MTWEVSRKSGPLATSQRSFFITQLRLVLRRSWIVCHSWWIAVGSLGIHVPFCLSAADSGYAGSSSIHAGAVSDRVTLKNLTVRTCIDCPFRYSWHDQIKGTEADFQNRWSEGRDTNPKSRKYEAGMLTTRMRSSTETIKTRRYGNSKMKNRNEIHVKNAKRNQFIMHTDIGDVRMDNYTSHKFPLVLITCTF